LSIWFGDLKWYLFGSHATGEADEYSDIDVMVEGVEPKHLDEPYWVGMTKQMLESRLDAWLYHDGVLYPVTQRERAPATDPLAVAYAMQHRKYVGDTTACLVSLLRTLPEGRACTDREVFVERMQTKHRRLHLRLQEFQALQDGFSKKHVNSDKLFVVRRSKSGVFKGVTFDMLMLHQEHLLSAAQFECLTVWRDRLRHTRHHEHMAVPGKQQVAVAHEEWDEENNELSKVNASFPVIVSAAHETKDGLVIPSPRHCDRTFHALTSRLGLKKPVPGTQGFVDQFGTFYNRKAAWFLHVTLGKGEYKAHGGPVGDLYSEHLY
jgi:hypothetical protein